MRGRKRWLMALSALGLLLAACGPASQATPTLAPTATAVPSSVSQTPTPTSLVPTATATARPAPSPTAAQAQGPKYGGVLTMDAPASLRSAAWSHTLPNL